MTNERSQIEYRLGIINWNRSRKRIASQEALALAEEIVHQEGLPRGEGVFMKESNEGYMYTPGVKKIADVCIKTFEERHPNHNPADRDYITHMTAWMSYFSDRPFSNLEELSQSGRDEQIKANKELGKLSRERGMALVRMPQDPNKRTVDQQQLYSKAKALASMRDTSPVFPQASYSEAQKFIIVKEGENLVFHSLHLPNHGDISAKAYEATGVSAEVLGGGLLGLSPNGKSLRLYDYSTQFGEVPREIIERFAPALINEARKINPELESVSIETPQYKSFSENSAMKWRSYMGSEK